MDTVKELWNTRNEKQWKLYLIKSNEINLRQDWKKNGEKLKEHQKIIILIKKDFFSCEKSNNTDNFLEGLIKDTNEQTVGNMGIQGIHCRYRSNKGHKSIYE